MVDLHTNFATADNYIATGEGGKRHMGITSKGVLWFGHRQTGNLVFYSAPSMNTLTVKSGSSGIANGVLTCAGEWSMFIDETDAIHVVYAKYAGAAGDTRTDKASIIYRHGTFNSTHTAITWSAEMAITGYDYWHSPDVVAHEHNGQIRAHICCSYNWSGDNRVIVYYYRVLLNKNDPVNHVGEEGQYLFDATASQAYISKTCIELRHNGDGKTPQLVNGVRTPDVFIIYNHTGNLQHVRKAWTSGNTWTLSNQFQLSIYGNCTSNGVGNYGGLYEHHRWQRALYSARDSRLCVVGWIAPGSFADQRLGLFEIVPGNTFTSLDRPDMVVWTGGAQAAFISGTAAMMPDGNIEVLGCGYNDPWYNQVVRAQILRPKSSSTRTLTGAELVHAGGFDGNGAHVDTLSHPPGGENHVVYRHPNTWMYYWRNNRGCNYVHTGTAVARRPKYRMHSDGVNLVPIAERV